MLCGDNELSCCEKKSFGNWTFDFSPWIRCMWHAQATYSASSNVYFPSDLVDLRDKNALRLEKQLDGEYIVVQGNVEVIKENYFDVYCIPTALDRNANLLLVGEY